MKIVLPNKHLVLLTLMASTIHAQIATAPDPKIENGIINLKGNQAAAAKMVLGAPFWKTEQMENEPLLLVQETGAPVATGTLLFIPTAAPRLTDPTGEVVYAEGRDYHWKPGTAIIERTTGLRMPFKTAAEMKPSQEINDQNFGGHLFSEGRFFHDLQILVTYRHGKVHDWPTQVASPRLTRVVERLRARRPIKLVAMGDSITLGSNASGFEKSLAPPFQPNYASLVTNTLGQRFGTTVKLVNLSVGGAKAGWGLTRVAALAQEQPDLVLLAFGMNNSEPAVEFGAMMKKLLDAVQAAAPAADVVVVAPMSSNPALDSSRFPSYLEVLRQLETDHVALADITSPWIELLKTKKFADLTGNNVNHPNDFGHRLYAQVICELFPIAPGTDASRDADSLEK